MKPGFRPRELLDIREKGNFPRFSEGPQIRVIFCGQNMNIKEVHIIIEQNKAGYLAESSPHVVTRTF